MLGGGVRAGTHALAAMVAAAGVCAAAAAVLGVVGAGAHAPTAVVAAGVTGVGAAVTGVSSVCAVSACTCVLAAGVAAGGACVRGVCDLAEVVTGVVTSGVVVCGWVCGVCVVARAAGAEAGVAQRVPMPSLGAAPGAGRCAPGLAA